MSKVLKKKEEYIPHKIRLEGKLGTQVYRKRMEMMGDFYPKIQKEEESAVFGVAHLMNQLKGDMVLEHPVHGIKAVVNRLVGPSAAYLIAGGRYGEDYLKSIRLHIKKGDKVLNIGAGFGLAAVLSAELSRHLVVAIEPYAELHEIIRKNAKENEVPIQVSHGCLVPGEQGGSCTFYVDEDVWSSSIYDDVKNEGALKDSLDVPIISLTRVLKEQDVDVLVMDAQGGELSLLTEKEALAPLKKIIVKVHNIFEEKEGLARLIKEMSRAGLHLESLIDKTCVFMR